MTKKQIREDLKKQLEDMIQELTNAMAKDRGEGKCPYCHKQGPFTFRDELSRKEYRISGLCQKCQDELFAKEEE